eukprot:CAMPEP_0194297312 /NCGR_PEP_ID=MMETSP0169-20130528/58588_1 /TAXON_ID=218684 /ORGANISM="Corethron pennatum, Strain L29A3" /LENGTH=104 /DNA_ID=CAMNT_0039047079 /DNA_START=114 /DNA_END=425 /DNA_ORIENTATION=+
MEPYDPTTDLIDSISYLFRGDRAPSFLSFWIPCEDASNPAVVRSLRLCFFLAAACFATSSVTGKVSQVDKLWSVAPVLYAWIAALQAPPDGPSRAIIAAALVTI